MLLKSSQILEVKRRYLKFLITFEATLILALTVVAVQLRNAGNLLNYRSGLKEYLLLTAFPIIWLACLSLFGAWDMRILENHIDGYRLLMGASAMTFLAFCSASYIFKIQISRFVILFSLIGGTLLHLFLRWLFLRFSDKNLRTLAQTQHWLFLTDNPVLSKEIEQIAVENEATIHFLRVDYSEFFTWVNQVISKVQELQITRVVLIDVSALKPVQIKQLMWAIQQSNTEFAAYDYLALATSQSRLHYFEGLNLVGIGEPRINESIRVLKRLFDLSLVLPALVLLTPIYVMVAILVKIDSPGKVLYTQKRIGQNGKVFTFPKFRSMREGADLDRLAVVGRPDENMTDRYKKDPRITRMGKFLRRYSLDELPQLWCVLIGTMSLVGPRPILPEEEPQLGNFDFRRHIAKPGLTGIWQVSGRKETSWDDRMAFDIKYVEEWSIALDLILITRTFKVVLSGKGSY